MMKATIPENTSCCCCHCLLPPFLAAASCIVVAALSGCWCHCRCFRRKVASSPSPSSSSSIVCVCDVVVSRSDLLSVRKTTAKTLSGPRGAKNRHQWCVQLLRWADFFTPFVFFWLEWKSNQPHTRKRTPIDDHLKLPTRSSRTHRGPVYMNLPTLSLFLRANGLVGLSVVRRSLRSLSAFSAARAYWTHSVAYRKIRTVTLRSTVVTSTTRDSLCRVPWSWPPQGFLSFPSPPSLSFSALKIRRFFISLLLDAHRRQRADSKWQQHPVQSIQGVSKTTTHFYNDKDRRYTAFRADLIARIVWLWRLTWFFRWGRFLATPLHVHVEGMKKQAMSSPLSSIIGATKSKEGQARYTVRVDRGRKRVGMF